MNFTWGKSKESCLETQLSRVSFNNFGNYDRRYQGNQHNNNRNDFGDYNKRYENRNNRGCKNYPPKKSVVFVKKCDACRSIGEPFIGHDVRTCPKILPSDRESLIKSFNLDVQEEEDTYDTNISSSTNDLLENINVDRVKSPKFNVKINNTMITMVLDTGTTRSMVSLEPVELLNLHVYPSSHSAMFSGRRQSTSCDWRSTHVDSNG